MTSVFQKYCCFHYVLKRQWIIIHLLIWLVSLTFIFAFFSVSLWVTSQDIIFFVFRVSSSFVNCSYIILLVPVLVSCFTSLSSWPVVMVWGPYGIIKRRWNCLHCSAVEWMPYRHFPLDQPELTCAEIFTHWDCLQLHNIERVSWDGVVFCIFIHYMLICRKSVNNLTATGSVTKVSDGMYPGCLQGELI